MKILVIDDDELYFKLLQMIFSGHILDYQSNPVSFFDEVHLNHTDLNQYDFIFCDYFFDNLSTNCFDLKCSFYIREFGYKNHLILFSFLSSLNLDDIKKNEYFDLVLDKDKIDSIEKIQQKCQKSSLRKLWESRYKQN